MKLAFLYFTLFILSVIVAVLCTNYQQAKGVFNYLHGRFGFESDDELGADAETIAKKYGYPLEVHEIQTEDGYILKTFRIPHSNTSSGRGRHGEPVLINPPFLSSATDYFVLSGDGALPFMYANAGFDVWLSNYRGSSLSRHVSLTEKDAQYWNFTMDKIAVVDFPAQIDYILNVTGRQKLVYYGFSLSANYGVLTLSERPEYNEKIRRMTLVAIPASMVYGNHYLYMEPIRSLWEAVAYLYYGKLVALGPFKPVLAHFCRYIPKICYFVLRILGEHNPEQIPGQTLARALWWFPDQTSVNVYEQIHQQFGKSYNHTKLNYGERVNAQVYGSTIPPDYNFSKVTVPVCGLYGESDLVVRPKSAHASLSKLQHWCNRDSGIISDPNWTHIDNMYGKDAPKLVYERSIRFHLQDESSCSC